MDALATHFSTILASLRAAIAHFAGRDRARMAFLVFESLLQQWRAGTLPMPSPPSPDCPAARPCTSTPTDRAGSIARVRGAAVGVGPIASNPQVPAIAAFRAATPPPIPRPSTLRPSTLRPIPVRALAPPPQFLPA